MKDPIYGDELVITADGVAYTLEAPAQYGNILGSHIRFNSNIGTPLAAWVDESFRKLEPCWSKEPPSDG